jgi:hypothetical protein
MSTRILSDDDHKTVRFGLPALPELEFAVISEAGIGEDGAREKRR